MSGFLLTGKKHLIQLITTFFLNGYHTVVFNKSTADVLCLLLFLIYINDFYNQLSFLHHFLLLMTLGKYTEICKRYEQQIE